MRLEIVLDMVALAVDSLDTVALRVSAKVALEMVSEMVALLAAAVAGPSAAAEVATV